MTSTLFKTWIGLLTLAVVGCSGTPQPVASVDSVTPTPEAKVGVYYMHRTFRCPTCLKIEKMAEQVVREQFAEELADGILRWDAVNYQEQDGVADRYGLSTSSLVVVSYQQGREVSHEVLDKTWALYSAPEQFEAYVVEAIRSRLDRK